MASEAHSSAALAESFLKAVRENDQVHTQLRGVTTAAGLAEVSSAIGLDIPQAALVKGFAQLLIEASDDLAIRNFDNLGWDMGELLWVAKTWEQAD